eukprot:g471.t1
MRTLGLPGVGIAAGILFRFGFYDFKSIRRLQERRWRTSFLSLIIMCGAVALYVWDLNIRFSCEDLFTLEMTIASAAQQTSNVVFVNLLCFAVIYCVLVDEKVNEETHLNAFAECKFGDDESIRMPVFEHDDGALIADAAFDEEASRIHKADKHMEFVMEHNFLTMLFYDIIFHLFGEGNIDKSLRTHEVILSFKKRLFLFLLLKYDCFVDICWRFVHLCVIGSCAIWSLHLIVVEADIFLDDTNYASWANKSDEAQELSNLCWASTLLYGDARGSNHAITYDSSIYSRESEKRIDELIGSSFVPSNECAMVRYPVFAWIAGLAFCLSLLSFLMMYVVRSLNQWTLAVESSTETSCFRFLRAGILVPALLFIPLIVYSVVDVEKRNIGRTLYQCADCIKNSSLFIRKECSVTDTDRCISEDAVGPQNIDDLDAVSFVGGDYVLLGAILIVALLFQIVMSSVFFKIRQCRRAGDMVATDGAGFALNRWVRRAMRGHEDDDNNDMSVTEQYEKKDSESQRKIRDIARRAKALSIKQGVLREVVVERFINDLISLIVSEHAYVDTLDALTSTIIPIVHKCLSKVREVSDETPDSPSIERIRRHMLSLAESRRVATVTAGLNALHVCHFRFVVRVSESLDRLVSFTLGGNDSKTSETLKRKISRRDKLLRQYSNRLSAARAECESADSGVEMLRLGSQNDDLVPEKVADRAASKSVDDAMVLKTVLPPPPPLQPMNSLRVDSNDGAALLSRLTTTEHRAEKIVNQSQVSIERGLRHIDWEDLADCISDLGDALPTYADVLVSWKHAALQFAHIRKADADVDRLLAKAEREARTQLLKNNDDTLPQHATISFLLSSPARRIKKLSKQLTSLRESAVLLRGYSVGSDLESNFIRASKVITEAVNHFHTCLNELSAEKMRRREWNAMRQVQDRFGSTVSCLSKDRRFVRQSSAMYLFDRKIKVHAFLFSDAVLLGAPTGNRDVLMPYELYDLVPRTAKVGRGFEGDASSKDMGDDALGAKVAESRPSSGTSHLHSHRRIIRAELHDLSKLKMYDGTCSCLVRLVLMIFNACKSVYDFLLVVCCGACLVDAAFRNEAYKRHRYRIVLVTDRDDRLTIRLGNDPQTKRWYESLKTLLEFQKNTMSSKKSRSSIIDSKMKESGGDVVVHVHHEDDYSDVPKELQARVKSLRELVATEEQYVESLSVAWEVILQPLLDIVFRPHQDPRTRVLPSIHFIDMMTSASNYPLSKACDRIKSSRSTVAISTLESILALHRNFLHDLKEASKNTTDEEQGNATIPTCSSDWICGPSLRSLIPLLRMYECYSSSCRILMRNLDDESLRSIRECWQENPRCKMLGASSFLISPIQRLPRYSLLIKDLIKATPKQHPDFKILLYAQAELNMALSYIDESALENK